MLFPTTLVGSYPQPEWLIDRARLAGRFPPRVRARELWRVSEPWLAEAQDDATRLAIAAQEDAGLDVVTDGEIRRESYSNRFATAIEGVDIDNPGTALDRSGHPNPVPHRRSRPPQAPGGGGGRALPARAHDAADQDHRAGPVHDVAAGAERPLCERDGGGDGLRRRGERGLEALNRPRSCPSWAGCPVKSRSRPRRRTSTAPCSRRSRASRSWWARDGHRAHQAGAAVRAPRERDPRPRLRDEVPAARRRRRQAAGDGSGGAALARGVRPPLSPVTSSC